MTPTHYLANKLHPIYCGRNLRPEHIETAQEYVLEENPEPLLELRHLQTDDITLPKTTPSTGRPNDNKSYLIGLDRTNCGVLFTPTSYTN
ncbi:hypothetical protein LSH36_455g07048 [Paralvinella palmiformis]|uniref:Uncharacterized protein n=1 Tax=Paralvinella palmiformis TaxID=53620 RepID=A0AAD9JAV4_9ANNE|nr:hypothetical protein LSH36_455g07048 [Paralvinella palmiformis]